MFQGRPITGQRLWEMLLLEALVFTDNLRVSPQLEFQPHEVTMADVDLANGKELGLYLYLLKNGDREDRNRFEDVVRTFERLTDRGFSVGRRNARPGQPGVTTVEKLTLSVQTDWGDVPLDHAGAGLAEALFLSTILLDPERITLLDEPASNLHPSVQRKLLALLASSARSQSIVITHSPYLVPSHVIHNTVRFYASSGATSIARAEVGAAPEGYIDSLTQDMAISTDTRALLFYDGVILTEGPTELGALPIWWEKHSGDTFESKNVTLYRTGSKTAFGRWMWYLSQMHVNWAAICDGDAIGDAGTTCEIDNQLAKAGVRNSSTTEPTDSFSIRIRKLSRAGIYTFARAPNDSFESLPVVQKHQQSASSQVGRSKARQGRWIAEQTQCPAEVATVLKEALAHLGF
jgi:hypothetical protein